MLCDFNFSETEIMLHYYFLVTLYPKKPLAPVCESILGSVMFNQNHLAVLGPFPVTEGEIETLIVFVPIKLLPDPSLASPKGGQTVAP